MNSILMCIIVVFGSVLVEDIATLPVEDMRPTSQERPSINGNNVELFSKEDMSNIMEFFRVIAQNVEDKQPKLYPNRYSVGANKGSVTSYAVDLPLFTCPVCKTMLGILESYLKMGKSVDEIEATCVNLCITLKQASELVCRGAIGAYVVEVVHIVQMSGISSKDICGFVVGKTCEPPGFEQRFNWSINAHLTPKPQVKPLKPPQAGRPTRRVLHLSDTHLDPYYEEGSSGACSLPLCCRSSVGMPQKPSDAAGKWGDHRHCDTPFRTLDHMMKHLAQNEKIDYIIWTGDLPPHDVYNQTKDRIMKHNHNVYTMFSEYFPHTPIFPALGNHESDPLNSFPQPDITDEEHTVAWLYNELSKSWPKLMLRDSFNTDTLIYGGFYSVLVEPGFRIISLNMNYGNNLNFWLLRDSNDPAGELAWLIDELGKAEANGEKVHLLGHIPPGNEDCLRIWGRNFRQIVNRFENTITAQFYGHSHYDEFIVFHDDDLKRATNIAYIGPSTTTFSFLNPGYKVYTVDGDYPDSTRMVIDGEGYFLNITEANLLDKPEWRKLFSYKKDYEMESLTPAEWSKLARRMSTDDAMFQKFLKHFHRASETFPACDAKCIEQMICKLVTAVAFDHSICKDMGIEASTSLFKTPGVLSYDRPPDFRKYF